MLSFELCRGTDDYFGGMTKKERNKIDLYLLTINPLARENWEYKSMLSEDICDGWWYTIICNDVAKLSLM